MKNQKKSIKSKKTPRCAIMALRKRARSPYGPVESVSRSCEYYIQIVISLLIPSSIPYSINTQTYIILHIPAHFTVFFLIDKKINETKCPSCQSKVYLCTHSQTRVCDTFCRYIQFFFKIKLLTCSYQACRYVNFARRSFWLPATAAIQTYAVACSYIVMKYDDLKARARDLCRVWADTNDSG